MKSDNIDDDYFEIKKVKLEEFEKAEKKQKVILLRRSITMAIVTITTSAVFGIKGYNPFLAFAELFTLPVTMLVYSNVKILSKLKQEKMKLLNEIHKDDTSSEVNSRGR